MPLKASSMLGANQAQTPNGTSLNASATLGLGAPGQELQSQLNDELEQRRKKLGQSLAGDGAQYGSPLSAAASIFGGMR